MDASVDHPTEVQIDNIEKCVIMIYHHVTNGYQQSRECLQFSIGQLERVQSIAVVKMILMAMHSIDLLASRFSKTPSPSTTYYDVKVDGLVIDQLINRIGPDISGNVNMSQLKPELSHKLIVRCQTKVHNCKCSYLCCNIILLFSEILLLIEFCFIISLIFLIFSPCPKYTSIGVRLSNDS